MPVYWKWDDDGGLRPTFRKPSDYQRGDEWPEYKYAWEMVRLALGVHTKICYLNWQNGGMIIGSDEEKAWPRLSLGHESISGRTVSIFWGNAEFWFRHKNKEFICSKIEWNNEPYATPELRKRFEHFLLSRGLLEWWGEMDNSENDYVG